MAASFISWPSAYPPGGERGPTQPSLMGSAAPKSAWSGPSITPRVTRTTTPARPMRRALLMPPPPPVLRASPSPSVPPPSLEPAGSLVGPETRSPPRGPGRTGPLLPVPPPLAAPACARGEERRQAETSPRCRSVPVPDSALPTDRTSSTPGGIGAAASPALPTAPPPGPAMPGRDTRPPEDVRGGMGRGRSPPPGGLGEHATGRPLDRPCGSLGLCDYPARSPHTPSAGATWSNVSCGKDGCVRRWDRPAVAHPFPRLGDHLLHGPTPLPGDERSAPSPPDDTGGGTPISASTCRIAARTPRTSDSVIRPMHPIRNVSPFVSLPG